MRTLTRPLAVLLAAVLLAACGDSALGDRAATVNGNDISRDLLERIVTAQIERIGETQGEELTGDALAEETATQQRNILSSLIAIEVVRGMVEDEGIEVSDEDIDEAYDQQVALFEEQTASAGEESPTSPAEANGMTEEEFREIVAADVARREALTAEYADEVTDEDVRAFYDETAEPQIDARHILVETEAEAQDAIERIEGGEDFADVAADVSTDGSAQDGGNLGPGPASRYVPEFGEAISNGEVGELLGPVETDFGFHVIEVLGVEDPPPFEESEEQLRAQLEQQVQQDPELIALYQEAFTGADVDVAAGLGEWDAEQGRVIDPDAPVGEGGGEVPAPEGEAPAPEGEQPADEQPADEQPADDGESAEQ